MIFKRQDDGSYEVEFQFDEIVYDHFADMVVLQMAFSGEAIERLAQDDNARVAMVRDFPKAANRVRDEGRAKAAENKRVTVGSGEILRAAQAFDDCPQECSSSGGVSITVEKDGSLTYGEYVPGPVGSNFHRGGLKSPADDEVAVVLAPGEVHVSPEDFERLGGADAIRALNEGAREPDPEVAHLFRETLDGRTRLGAEIAALNEGRKP